ncbi:hypothetical protein ACOCEA_06930 [Maribacter sp. CXY002]|uniref:hypothetical protein n=1 Tax=Maribacter luteocoastalis TaxID=3407671 RepID=UPI003B67B569
MLLYLFEEKAKQEKDGMGEMISKYVYNRLKEIRKEKIEDLLKFLLKVEHVKPRYGNPYWKIDINTTELDKLKNKMLQD